MKGMVPCTEHYWIGGVYYRKHHLPAGESNAIEAHKHHYDHGSICAMGSGEIRFPGEPPVPYAAGDILEVKAGVQHQVVAFADSIWICAHAVEKQEDLDKIARELIAQ